MTGRGLGLAVIREFGRRDCLSVNGGVLTHLLGQRSLGTGDDTRRERRFAAVLAT